MSEFYATVIPNAHGGWHIAIGSNEHSAGSDALWRRHGIDTIAGALTRRGAERKARRLIRCHERAAARLARPGFTVQGS